MLFLRLSKAPSKEAGTVQERLLPDEGSLISRHRAVGFEGGHGPQGPQSPGKVRARATQALRLPVAPATSLSGPITPAAHESPLSGSPDRHKGRVHREGELLSRRGGTCYVKY